MPYQEHVLLSFLQSLKVPFTRRYLDNVISGLAGNNTLSAISDVLNSHYNVENVCLLIDKNDIHKLDSPFLAQLELPFAPVVIVTDLRDGKLSCIYKNKRYREQLSSFLTKWNGTVLLAEPTENSMESNYWQNRLHSIIDQSRLPFFVVLFASLLFTYSRISFSDFTLDGINAVLLILYGLGLGVCTLLVAHSIVKSGSFVDRVCNGGTKKGCSKILKSSAAKFLGLVSWSEIGFFYFLSSFISFLLIDKSIGFLFVLSACTLPYTFWSVYYQWKIARQWCLFCVTIQLIFWAVFATYLIHYKSTFPVIEILTCFQVITCFILVASSLWLILPYSKSYYKLRQLNLDYRSFKFNPSIIQSSFELTNQVNTTYASNIIFGTPESELMVSVLTDIYCPHCIEAHQHIKELRKIFGDQISIQFIFAIPLYIETAGEFYNRTIAEKYEIIKSLIGIYLNNEKSSSEAKFNQWFEKGKDNYKKFIGENKIVGQDELVEKEFNKQQKWVRKLDQSGTPTFFINHRQLPVWYNPSELVNLVGAMII